MLLSGQQTGCPWVVQPSHGVLLPLLRLQRGSLRRAWCYGVSGWAELLGWAKGDHIPAHISGDSVGHVSPLLAARGDIPASRCWAESGQKAGKCLSAASWPGHPLGPGPRGSAGLGGGFAADPSLPSAALGELTVTEPVLSQRSAITHSRKPRQLRSVPRWAPCQGIDCP